MSTAHTDPSAPDIAAPTLPGEVCAQYIQCGKPGCRCQQGQRHGPYYYRIWREGSRVHKVYVSRDDLESVRRACAAHRDCRQRLRDTRVEREALSRRIRHQCRQSERLLGGRRTGASAP